MSEYKVKYIILEATNSETVDIKEPTMAPTTSRQENGEYIGAKIKQLRLDRNLTQAQIADKIQMARPNYTRIESGKHEPSLTTLRKIADALEIDLQSLIFS